MVKIQDQLSKNPKEALLLALSPLVGYSRGVLLRIRFLQAQCQFSRALLLPGETTLVNHRDSGLILITAGSFSPPSGHRKGHLSKQREALPGPGHPQRRVRIPHQPDSVSPGRSL